MEKSGATRATQARVVTVVHVLLLLLPGAGVT